MIKPLTAEKAVQLHEKPPNATHCNTRSKAGRSFPTTVSSGYGMRTARAPVEIFRISRNKNFVAKLAGLFGFISIGRIRRLSSCRREEPNPGARPHPPGAFP